MDDKLEILKKLRAIDPESLAAAHDEVISGFDKDGNPIVKGDPTFEIDGKLHTVPFSQLRTVLRENRTSPPQQVFRGRIPKSVEIGASFDIEDEEEGSNQDGSYYWDKNYNYEYMNPESEKRRVLGKIRK